MGSNMNLGERLTTALQIDTAFTIRVGGLSIPITETVVVSWVVMAVLILGSLLLVRRMRTVPKGGQIFLEAYVGGLESLGKEYFGGHGKNFVPYVGSLFLFLILSNVIGLFSPIGAFGLAAPFELKPPTRDINVTAACAIMTILIVLISGLRARGFLGWAKRLAYPTPMMVPFNLLEYFIRPLSLCLRLFGNILGAFIIMVLIEALVPVGIPPILSLYFDILDGLIQALVFTFLTTLFIAEAIE